MTGVGGGQEVIEDSLATVGLREGRGGAVRLWWWRTHSMVWRGDWCGAGFIGLVVGLVWRVEGIVLWIGIVGFVVGLVTGSAGIGDAGNVGLQSVRETPGEFVCRRYRHVGSGFRWARSGCQVP